MAYGNDLLALAIEAARTKYVLAQLTGIQESHLSEAERGKRQVPASWINRLALIAGVDPAGAMHAFDSERLLRPKKSSPLVRRNSDQADLFQ